MKTLVLLGTLAFLAVPANNAAAATPAVDTNPVVRVVATCDFPAAEWNVTWSVINPNSVEGTIGNVRVTPPGEPLVGMPNRLPAMGMVTGSQRVAGSAPTTASITFDVNWDDGTVTYDVAASLFLGRCGPPPTRTVLVSANAVCDAAAHEWSIFYNITNANAIAGTIGNVRVYPPGSALQLQSDRLLPFGTVVGNQRIPADQYTASITFDVNWDDNVVTYNIYWPVYIKTTCR
jgi:Fe2+ transport system protein FeoA